MSSFFIKWNLFFLFFFSFKSVFSTVCKDYCAPNNQACLQQCSSLQNSYQNAFNNSVALLEKEAKEQNFLSLLTDYYVSSYWDLRNPRGFNVNKGFELTEKPSSFDLQKNLIMRSLSFDPILDPRVFFWNLLKSDSVFPEEKTLPLLLFGKKETLDPFFLESLLDPFPDTQELDGVNSKSSESKKVKALIKAVSSSLISSVFVSMNELRIKENTLIQMAQNRNVTWDETIGNFSNLKSLVRETAFLEGEHLFKDYLVFRNREHQEALMALILARQTKFLSMLEENLSRTQKE